MYRVTCLTYKEQNCITVIILPLLFIWISLCRVAGSLNLQLSLDLLLFLPSLCKSHHTAAHTTKRACVCVCVRRSAPHLIWKWKMNCLVWIVSHLAIQKLANTRYAI